MAGRDASGKVLNALARNVPWLMGGSADLTPSTKTRLTFEGAGDFSAGDYAGRNLHFGVVREHAMASIMNGMALVKVRAYGSGFLIFSDYARGAIRLRRADGTPGDSTSSPTTQSAWVKTGPRTSRWSIWPPFGPCPG